MNKCKKWSTLGYQSNETNLLWIDTYLTSLSHKCTKRGLEDKHELFHSHFIFFIDLFQKCQDLL